MCLSSQINHLLNYIWNTMQSACTFFFCHIVTMTITVTSKIFRFSIHLSVQQIFYYAHVNNENIEIFIFFFKQNIIHCMILTHCKLWKIYMKAFYKRDSMWWDMEIDNCRNFTAVLFVWLMHDACINVLPLTLLW